MTQCDENVIKTAHWHVEVKIQTRAPGIHDQRMIELKRICRNECRRRRWAGWRNRVRVRT